MLTEFNFCWQNLDPFLDAHLFSITGLAWLEGFYVENLSTRNFN